MRTLLLRLPLTAPGPAAVYGTAEFDLAAAHTHPSVSSAPLALLPRATRHSDTVAMVPAAALSWHRLTLPAGLGRAGSKAGAKLQAALQGLIEERLLQDPAQVHLALAPQWAAGEPVWVAACDKAWLQAHLQALHEAGRPVQRIVPEFAPPASGQSWHALGDEASGWLWHCDAEHGVSAWPVAAAALPEANAALQAEPGLVRWAQAHHPGAVTLVDSAAHWRAAASGPWNLAQFELQSDARSRRLQGLRSALDTLARHPQWRPARWGLLALLLSQLIGLQAWAWMTRQQWQAEEAQWTQILQQSFPKISVVVDAPLQMARELARLRQASGQLTAQDFESQLQALGSALPAGVAAPARLDYQDGQLQWPALSLSAEQRTAFEQALQRQGYRLRGDAGLQGLEAKP